MHDPIQPPRPLASSDAPPFRGFVECTTHALRIVHAAANDVLPRMTRRLDDAERRALIHSGAVFVFSVAESGIKRWTDGHLWSPSRIVGNFLVYRELDSPAGKRAPSAAHSVARPSREFVFKHDGLMKRTMTVTVGRSELHLVCYYTQRDPLGAALLRPSSRPDIMALPMPVDVFKHTSFRVAPRTIVDEQGRRAFVEEDDAPAPASVDDLAYSPQAPETGHVRCNIYGSEPTSRLFLDRAQDAISYGSGFPWTPVEGSSSRPGDPYAAFAGGDDEISMPDDQRSPVPWGSSYASPIAPQNYLPDCAPRLPYGICDEAQWRNAR